MTAFYVFIDNLKIVSGGDKTRRVIIFFILNFVFFCFLIDKTKVILISVKT